ncbi:flagellar protein FliT [Alicyclobacillus macrosporangiidus]|uniref:flagellar protein FliT n=1 Tax=Alicyclobacillus macrosporangiidus TaxID=392015 RepID=UPI0005583788|nr:flagellar protein FliT [Alicyclobacillus macrosporangiidus]
MNLKHSCGKPGEKGGNGACTALLSTFETAVQVCRRLITLCEQQQRYVAENDLDALAESFAVRERLVEELTTQIEFLDHNAGTPRADVADVKQARATLADAIQTFLHLDHVLAQLIDRRMGFLLEELWARQRGRRVVQGYALVSSKTGPVARMFPGQARHIDETR